MNAVKTTRVCLEDEFPETCLALSKSTLVFYLAENGIEQTMAIIKSNYISSLKSTLKQLHINPKSVYEIGVAYIAKSQNLSTENVLTTIQTLNEKNVEGANIANFIWELLNNSKYFVLTLQEMLKIKTRGRPRTCIIIN